MELETAEMSECRYLEEYGVYVTDDGKVLKEVAQWDDRRGYKCISLHSRPTKNLQVHRLVAKAFIPYNESSDGIVMHKDDNPHNNCVDNLMWGTYSQNIKDAYDHDLRTNNKKTLCIETGEVFMSAREAARQMFGIPKRGDHILQVCRGGRAYAYGYHWELIDEGVVCR